MLVLGEKGHIALCSANAGEFTGVPVEQMLSKHYDAALPQALAKLIRDYQPTHGQYSRVPYVASFDNRSFDCFFRSSPPYMILECITSGGHPYSVYDVVQHTNSLVQAVNMRINLQSLCQLITRKIHEITGYDRVMVYRFDKNYNGDIFAETVVKGHEPYLGLHYPHTDIPIQARALYVRNLMRLIADVNYEPVPLVTLEKEIAKPETIDMSEVHLRSVSPIHIQYLKNIGVKGTFTISLIKDGRLWGLVACHHYSPLNLTYVKQIQAFLQTQILSSQLTVQETAETYDLAAALEPALRTLLTKLSGEGDFVNTYFSSMKEIREVTNSAGAALIVGEKIYRNGATPDESSIKELNAWLLAMQRSEYHTDNLGTEFTPAKNYERLASGVLFYRVSNTLTDISLIYFRPSQDRVITWGGAPNEAEGIAALTPRNSFEIWKQNVKGESMPWREPEKHAGFQFLHALQQNLFSGFLRAEESRVRQLNEELMKANKELENINWIGSHDLKEPLRKIKLFASMLQVPADAPQKQKLSVEKIKGSAEYMQKLIDDLLIYSKMSNKPSALEWLDLGKLIRKVAATFDDEYSVGLFRLELDELPQIYGNRFQMQQIFVNLIGNSIKFRSDSRPQVVKITSQTHNGIRISVCDSGVGFQPNLAERIFEVFQRGHDREELEGTGVGLAICRKIMENHGGTITAESREGGACFHLTFPDNPRKP